jgi:hypothetical protein
VYYKLLLAANCCNLTLRARCDGALHAIACVKNKHSSCGALQRSASIESDEIRTKNNANVSHLTRQMTPK